MPTRDIASNRSYAKFPYPYDVEALGLGPVSYWPLDDSTAIAVDSSINENDAAYVGSTYILGEPGIGDRSRSVRLNPGGGGGGDSINIYSAGFNSVFDGNEGSFGIWTKVNDAAEWDLGGYLMHIYSGEPNRHYITKIVSNSMRLFRKAGGTAQFPTLSGQTELGWVHWLMTWSVGDDKQIAYKNGVVVNTKTSLGTYVGALNGGLTKIGNFTTAAGYGGWMAKGIVFDRPVTAAEAIILGTVRT